LRSRPLIIQVIALTGSDLPYWQLQVLSFMFLSLIVHLSVPGGDSNDALPLPIAESNLANTRRFVEFTCSVKLAPCLITLPVPIKVVPLQQNRNSPVNELKSSTFDGSESSCKHTLNTVTVKLHDTLLPDGSLAVQFTAVVPAGKMLPDGGVHTTVAPGQLSTSVGGG
jgi:hypothetical protein